VMTEHTMPHTTWIKTILLAEDDLDIRDCLQDFLENKGYDVVPVRTGRQALEFLTGAEPPPDIVLIDLMMPLVTGWQVIETIRHTPALSRIPVVVLSASEQDRPAGVAAFLRKPFDIETLLKTLEWHLDHARSN